MSRNRFTCKKITSELVHLGITAPINPGKLSIKEIQTLVANYAHVVVGVQTTSSFQQYKSGIFSDDKCQTGTGNVNHAVVIVGYDLDKKYWIIRNSWVKFN